MRLSSTATLMFTLLAGVLASIAVRLPAASQSNYYQPNYQNMGQGGPGYSSTLPQPTPPTYGPSPNQNQQPNFQQPNYQGPYPNYPQGMGRHSHGRHSMNMNMGMSGHHGRHGGGYPMSSSNNNYGSYNPYPFGQPHTPDMQIQNFDWPASRLDARSAADETVPPVELLAKQKRLVIDDKTAQ